MEQGRADFRGETGADEHRGRNLRVQGNSLKQKISGSDTVQIQFGLARLLKPTQTSITSPTKSIVREVL